MGGRLKNNKIITTVISAPGLLFLLTLALYFFSGHSIIEALTRKGYLTFLSRVITVEGGYSLRHALLATDILFFRFSVVYLSLYFFAAFFAAYASEKYGAALIICLVILICGSAMHIYGGMLEIDSQYGWGIDDSYINYRYANNLINGHGLVYDPGERVEGYTNLFYTLLMSLGILLTGPEGVYGFSCILNLIFLSLTLFLLYRHAERCFGPKKAVLVSLLFSLCPPMWIWAASGNEALLVVFVQLVAWVSIENISSERNARALIILPALSALSVLLRADGFVFSGIMIFYLFLKGRKKEALLCGAAAAIFLFGHMFWRYSYYGYILPNTYYAKVDGPILERLYSGIKILYKIIFERGTFAYLLLLAFGILAAAIRSVRAHTLFLRELNFAHFFTIAWLIYWFYIGGDHLADRFVIIFFPLGIFELFRLIEKSPKKIAVFLISLILVIQLKPAARVVRYIYVPRARYDMWMNLGRFLGERYPGKLLATAAVGKIAYFSGLETIDMLGLTNEFLAHQKTYSFWKPAHNKYNADYIISRKPDIIATWFEDYDLNLQYGLKREKYICAGYFLKYLVNCSPNVFGRENIINVEGLREKQVVELLEKGYNYAILEKGERTLL